MRKEAKLSEIAAICGAKLKGDGDKIMNGVASLSDAGADEISFLTNKRYSSKLAGTKAGAVIAPSDCEGELPSSLDYLFSENPNMAFSKIIEFFAPEPIVHPLGIAKSAVVSPGAIVSASASIGSCAVIEDGVKIGDKVVIGAGTYIGHFSSVGDGTLIYPNVTIRERSVIGRRVIIHSGSVLGADGYGFEAGPQGIVKIPQLGIVQIDDDVEIGALCTVDRARFGKTWIKRGVKMDDHVHVAHNVIVGEFSMLVGQCGIAGSAVLGRGVIVAAQAGINGHITIGDGVKIAGTSGVVKDVKPGETMVGTPAELPREFMARLTLPKRVSKMALKIAELEESLEKLKNECSCACQEENIRTEK